MKQLSLVCVCCFVVNFFPFSAAGNQSVRFQLAEVVRNCRTTHVHHGRNVDHTFFAVAEKPENAYPAVISEDLEQVSYNLEVLRLCNVIYKKFCIQMFTMIMRLSMVSHKQFSFNSVLKFNSAFGNSIIIKVL